MNMNASASVIGSGRTEMGINIEIVKGKGRTGMTTGIATVTAI